MWDKWRHKWRHKCLTMLRNKDYMHCLTHWSGRCWSSRRRLFVLILSASTCMCFLMGGWGAYINAFWEIFQTFGHGILLEKIGLLFCEWKPKCWTKSFSESHCFHLFLQHAFFTYVQAKFGKFLLAQVFLDFGCATFLSGDKPQIFGFIVMKSGPRRSLNTSLLRLLYARWTLGDGKIFGWIGTGGTCITITKYMY